MREERIVVHPFEELRVEEYRGFQQINEHATVKISGQIPYEKKEEYMKNSGGELWVQVAAVSPESAETILMNGVVERIEMEIIGRTCRMKLEIASGTVLMDCERKTRSFQNTGFLYSDILDVCDGQYDAAARIMTVAKGESTGQFIMQYRETDWNFIKRLASMNHTVVVPDCRIHGEKYYFGLPEMEKKISGDSVEYSVCCDIEEYWYKKECGLDVTPLDTTSYIWESREIYHLGEYGVLDGHQQFIWKIETKMKGSVLYHTYYMRPKPSFQVPVWYNTSVSGASLMAVVRGVKEEKVQMEILEDENKQGAGVYWFPYATVYSTQDGTGWYCMPEIDDKIRIYFPTEKEQDAYAASAYHEGGTGLRNMPEKKFWRNKEGKEIQLAPEKILLTDNNGSYIELSDANGVEIVSSGTVTLSAAGMLSISSRNSTIELSAPKRVKLKQGDTMMDLGGDLNLSGAQIKL